MSDTTYSAWHLLDASGSLCLPGYATKDQADRAQRSFSTCRVIHLKEVGTPSEASGGAGAQGEPREWLVTGINTYSGKWDVQGPAVTPSENKFRVREVVEAPPAAPPPRSGAKGTESRPLADGALDLEAIEARMEAMNYWLIEAMGHEKALIAECRRLRGSPAPAPVVRAPWVHVVYKDGTWKTVDAARVWEHADDTALLVCIPEFRVAPASGSQGQDGGET